MEFLENRILLTAGDLDTSFGSGGFTVADLNFSSKDELSDMAADPTRGGFVAVGTMTPAAGGAAQLVIARFRDDGKLDPTFGSGGRVLNALGGKVAAVGGLTVDRYGQIVVGVTMKGSTPTDPSFFRILRYDANGTIDTNFGTGGSVTTTFVAKNYTLDSDVEDLAIDSQGRIVAVGTGGLPTGSDAYVVLARFLTDGTLDSSFGTGGKTVSDLHTAAGVEDFANAVAIDGSDRVVVAGFSGVATKASDDFLVARYLANGKLDTSFGTGGFATSDILSASDDRAEAVAIDPSGRIVVAGSSRSSNRTSFAAVRYRADGKPDTSFAYASLSTLDSSMEGPYAVAIDPFGRVVVAGGADGLDGTSFREFVTLGRFGDTGAADSSFGSGTSRASWETGLDRVGLTPKKETVSRAVAIDSLGRIVVAGTMTQSSTNSDFVLARVLGTTAPTAYIGSPDSVAEGDSVVLRGSGSDPDDSNNLLSFEWDLDGDGVFGETGASAARGDEKGAVVTFSAAGLNGPSGPTVSLRAKDGQGEVSAAATTKVSVYNLAPVVALSAPAQPPVGGAAMTASGSFTDPGAETWTATVDYGDGSGSAPLTLAANKTFVLNHTYADAGRYTAVVTVKDSDGASGKKSLVLDVAPRPDAPAPTVAFRVPEATVAAGDGQATLTVTRDGTSTGTSTVRYATADGTAIAGRDFAATSGVLTFGPGETSKSISVPLIDAHAGGPRAFRLDLSAPGGATLGPITSTAVTIGPSSAPSDPPASNPGTIGFAKAAQAFDEGGGPAVVTLRRTGGTAGVVSVDVVLRGGDAAAGVHYAPFARTVTFLDGQDALDLQLPILHDGAYDADRTVNLELARPTGGASLAAPPAIAVTIRNTDPPPLVVPLDASVIAGRGKKVTQIVLRFSGALDTGAATNIGNYRLTLPGRGAARAKNAKAIKLRSASFDAKANAVTLTLAAPWKPTKPAELRALAASTPGLSDRFGRLVDGERNGRPGGDVVVTIRGAAATISP